MRVKQLEENKVVVQLENGDFLEIKEEAVSNKVVVVYDTGHGPKRYFEFDYKNLKLSELKTFG